MVESSTFFEIEYGLKRKGAKISALSYGDTNKYEYYKGEGIIPPEQSRIREQVKFTSALLGKKLKKK